jgi:small-conductance mechanosensitive channel
MTAVWWIPERLPEGEWAVWEFGRWGPWLSVRLLHVFLYLAGAFLLDQVWRILLRKAQAAAQSRDPSEHKELERRIATVTLIVRKLGTLALYTTALLMALNDFGVAIGPLLAGLGIVGVAVGFGAQYLVKDLITGFFVVLEDQFRVGDSVKINDFAGVVERMTLRVTEIRGLSGELHTVPNGEIRCVTNFSRHWARAIVDVPVDRNAPTDEIAGALREAGRRLQEDTLLGPTLLEPPEALGIVAMDGMSATARLWVKTSPSKKLDVERALRREILKVFAERRLETSLIQRTIILESSADGAGGRGS